MKFYKVAVLLLVAFALQACSEEGFVKVFRCPEDKPYLNTVNNLCYSSEEAAEEVNKYIRVDEEDAGNDGGSKTVEAGTTPMEDEE